MLTASYKLYTLTKARRYPLLVNMKELSNLFIKSFTEISGSACQKRDKYGFFKVAYNSYSATLELFAA